MDEKSNLIQELISMVRDKYNQLNDYYNFSLLSNIQDYNRADTVNMSDEEMNKFRHIAGSAQSAVDLGTPLSFGLGVAKEFKDLRRGDGWADAKYDWGNNRQGWEIHKQYPNLQDEQLYDHVFNNYIKPYRK